MIIKCKMCGGDIQFNPGDTCGQCDHCGCTTTFPKLPDEQRTNLFNRANHFRRQCEFDKAMAAYEHILEEDETDAEAHWGIVLSKFGIEYVEDPVTHERIPTCHRAQVISILSDEDYQNALKFAPDTHSREIYEKEAKRIAEIQKGILAISSQEKPYDVFICYKEADDNGSRTKDSTLAQEIYYQLTNEGYKVFFSRITLEDKLGQEYEPYIFAALNSAKVMLVVGTKPEYFNAIWVKNEWSRYLALMKNDRKRVLIPCYRDMDPYDLPEELSSLQSQDMSKIGFMQDIIHGVKKVLGTDKQSPSNIPIQSAGPGVASLHKRAVLFLEDSDWDSATEYFDRILDIDPEYAPAYIGKVQVKNKVHREADLARCREPISKDPDFQKAVRFADEKQKSIYNGYNRTIVERIELERKEAVYREAVALENRAAVENEFIAAAQKFDAAGEIRDAKERAANCRAKAASAKAEAEKAAAVYKEQMERERKERARQEEEKRAAEEARKKAEAERQRKEEELKKEKNRRIIKICSVIAAAVVLITGGYFVYEKVILPKIKYDQAQALLNDGKLDEAYAAFNDMLDYGDSATKLLEIHYQRAEGFLAEGKLSEAKQHFGLASGYSDAEQQIKNIDAYMEAETDYRNNDLISAGKKYQALNGFLDSAAKFESVSATLYAQATDALEAKNYEQAYGLLTALGDYSDCQALMAGVDKEYEAALKHWQEGEKLQAEQELQALEGWRVADKHLISLRIEIADDAAASEDYDTALAYYGKVPDTEGIDAKIAAAKRGKAYQEAVAALESGKLDYAYGKFLAATGHKDADQQAVNLKKYRQANDLLASGEFEEARILYIELGDYLDSDSSLAACNKAIYQKAANLYNSGDKAQAYALYTTISGYSDSAEIVAGMDSDYQTAAEHIEKGERLEAESILVNLVGWKDVDYKLEKLREEIADDAAAREDYDTALAYYGKVPDAEGIETKIAAAKRGKAYQEAVAALESGKLDDAYSKFLAATGHKDADQQAMKLEKYQRANDLMASNEYEEARSLYIELGDYLDSSSGLAACNEAIYQKAANLYNSGNKAQAYALYTTISGYLDSTEIMAGMESDYQTAVAHIEKGEKLEAEIILVSLAGWKDVDDRLEKLREEIADDAAQADDFDTAIAYYNKLNNKTEEVEAKLAKVIQRKNYSEAVAALEAGNLESAYAKFTAAGEYKDAVDQAGKLDTYQKANAAMAEGKYQEARKEYIQLGTYLDSPTNLEVCNAALYEEAAELKKNGDYAKAYELFTLISGYSDSNEITKQIRDDYKTAEELLKNGKYNEANAAFTALHNYSDSETKARESIYQKAESLKESGDYDDAIAAYSGLGEYKDSKVKTNDCLYSKAEAQIRNNDTDSAIAIFESIPDYKDSLERAKALRYTKAKALWDSGDLQAAKKEYEVLADYSDVPQLLTKVQTEIADSFMANKDYTSALSAYQELEQTAEIKEREYKLAQICYDEGYYAEATAAYETLGQYEFSLSKLPIARYAWANQLFLNKEYEKAADQFTILGDMADSEIRVQESVYQLALTYRENNQYDEGKELFLSISGYSDSDNQAKECDYRKACSLLEKGENKEAQSLFETLGDYADSKIKAEICIYNQAGDLFASGEYIKAKNLYNSISYDDSKTLAIQCVYYQAELLYGNNDYSGAREWFESIDYLDSKEKAKICAYKIAEKYYDTQQYAEAESCFLELNEYSDSSDRAKDCHVRQGDMYVQNGEYEKALTFFETVEYGDSAIKAAKCHYELGRAAYVKGNIDEAVAQYSDAVLLPEVQSALISMARDYLSINETRKAIQVLWLIRDKKESKELLRSIAKSAYEKGDFVITLLAYLAEGNKAALDIDDSLTTINLDKLKKELDYCNLLPSHFRFQKVLLYDFATTAYENQQYELAQAAYQKVGDYRDAADMVLEIYYRKGEIKRSQKDWDGAVADFTSAGEYSDAATQITETYYQQANSLLDEKAYLDARKIFLDLQGYKQSSSMADECIYRKAIDADVMNQYDDAIKDYMSLNGYKDSEILLDQIIIRQRHAVINTEGASFYMGMYENWRIKWKVLSVQNGKSFVIAENSVESLPYDENGRTASWSGCSLRRWLENVFYPSTFNEYEKKEIIGTISILSLEEMDQYHYHPSGTWTKTPRPNAGSPAVYTYWSGGGGTKTFTYVYDTEGVKPVMWIKPIK